MKHLAFHGSPLGPLARLAVLVLAPSLLLGPAHLHAQNGNGTTTTTNTGDLVVTGNLDVQGSSLFLGTPSDTATPYGLLWQYQESGTSHVPTLSLSAGRANPVWLWRRLAGSPAASVAQMRLDGGNALTLFDQTTPTPNAAIVLDPVAGSTFQASVSLNGPDNRMPNQQVTSGSSVLTRDLADARYGTAQTSGNSVSFGPGASAAGNATATAIGYAANASNVGSTALGANGVASGYASTALGVQATANNTFSTALGYLSLASAENATALGVQAQAAGQGSVALGQYSVASNVNAAALGQNSAASGPQSTALGNHSRATAEGSSAFGYGSAAVNTYTVALGYYSAASGYWANALGVSSVANGYQSVTLGGASGASGTVSEALGYNSAAQGYGSMALGNVSRASGFYASALSAASVASGDFATSAGRTEASSLYQLAAGAYGKPGGDAHNWVATDAIFSVGNGQDAAHPSDALRVNKNGDVTIQGVITAKPGGDIPMYTGQ